MDRTNRIERGLVTTTFLFTDIEGSTRRWEASPDMPAQVRDHFAALRTAVDAAGGEVFATMGDGVAAAFPSSEAAVAAAVDGQRRMLGIGLPVRMGIHTGDVARVGGESSGRCVNRAARIMAAAHGGQILLSNVSAALLRGRPDPVELDDLGSHRLRDLAEPERLWQVVHPDLPRAFPSLRGLDGALHHLPARRASLIGRTQEIAQAAAVVGRQRVVTLTGAGGIGKTTLATEVARAVRSQFADVWFVELAGVTDAGDVAAMIARTLDPGALSGDPTLLVLDNCEHVIDAAAEAIEGLTDRFHHLHVLTTSREPLGLAGEHLHVVRSLDPATTASQLFRERAQAAGADLESADPAEVEHLCARLDGIPLAIELAAAQAGTLGLGAIALGLGSRLPASPPRRGRTLGRHATMRATIDWSYQLLDIDERRTLEWMAVFASGFEPDAARHVAGSMRIDPQAALDHVASLVHRSLLVAAPGEQGVRYRMLEPLRAFALEALDRRGERRAAHDAMAAWVATITDLPYLDCCSPAVQRNAIRLEREADTWRDAMAHAVATGSAELGARLCGPPVAFFLLGRHDLAASVRPLLELCGTHVRHRRAVLCALMVSSAGETPTTPLSAWAAELLAFDEQEPTGLGALMHWLARAWRGEFDAAIDVCVRVSLDDRVSQGTRDLLLGIATLDHFSLTEATVDREHLITRALLVADATDVPLARATCLLGAAWGLADADPDRALRLVHRALGSIEDVPALTRLTLPGSASRLLSRLDPQIAARSMLEQLDSAPATASASVDLIPLLYAAELVDRLGHQSAGSALATIAAPPATEHLSMMDFVAVARRATSSTIDPTQLDELEATVRAALTDILTTETT